LHLRVLFPDVCLYFAGSHDDGMMSTFEAHVTLWMYGASSNSLLSCHMYSSASCTPRTSVPGLQLHVGASIPSWSVTPAPFASTAQAAGRNLSPLTGQRCGSKLNKVNRGTGIHTPAIPASAIFLTLKPMAATVAGVVEVIVRIINGATVPVGCSD
jgi:hypothetical protein